MFKNLFKFGKRSKKQLALPAPAHPSGVEQPEKATASRASGPAKKPLFGRSAKTKATSASPSAAVAGKGYRFLLNPSDLTAEPGVFTSKDKILVGGFLALTTLSESFPPGPEFLKQTPRSARGGLLGGPVLLQVWAHVQLRAFQRKHRWFKPRLLVDALLSWLLHRRKDTVLVGTMDDGTDGHVVVLIYSSKGRRLVRVNDFALPSERSDVERFRSDLEALVTDLRKDHPAHEFMLWTPSGQSYAGLTAISLDPWKASRPLVFTTGAPEHRSKGLAAPLLLLAALCAGYAAVLYDSYAKYQQATRTFDTEFQAMQTVSTKVTEPLEDLQARKTYLEALPQRKQITGSMQITQLLGSLAATGGRIQFVRIHFAPGTPSSGDGLAPELEFTLEVTKDDTLEALAQGDKLLSIISASTGYRLVLDRQGFSEITETLKQKKKTITTVRRVYRVKGVRA